MAYSIYVLKPEEYLKVVFVDGLVNSQTAAFLVVIGYLIGIKSKLIAFSMKVKPQQQRR